MTKKNALAWPDDPKVLMKDAEKWHAKQRLIDQREKIIRYTVDTWTEFIIIFGFWPIVIGSTVNILWFSAEGLGFLACSLFAVFAVFVFIMLVIGMVKHSRQALKIVSDIIDAVAVYPLVLPIAYTWYMSARVWNRLRPKLEGNKTAVMRKYLAVQLQEQQKRVQSCEQLKNLEKQIEDQLARTKKFKEQFKLRRTRYAKEGKVSPVHLQEASLGAIEREKKLEEARDKLKTYRAKSEVFFEEAEKWLHEEGWFGDLELIEAFVKDGAKIDRLEMETDTYIDNALAQIVGEINRSQKALETASLAAAISVPMMDIGSGKTEHVEVVLQTIEDITEELLKTAPQIPACMSMDKS